MTETRKIAAILAADVVGYSRLVAADEEGALARLRALRSDLVDPTVAVHHGRVVKRMGDGLIVEFRSVVSAVRCAIEMQSAMVERNAGVAADKRIEFRVGVHLGDVVEEEDGDLMGDGVNIAARIEGIAAPGAICLSEDAYRQVRDRVKESFVDLGEKALKNIARPVRIFAIGSHRAGEAQMHAAPLPEEFEPPQLPLRVLPYANSGDRRSRSPLKAGPVNELLERQRELATVEELLGRYNGVLAIEAGVGIGKTSLVQAACRRAQELDYQVLSARGSELEADFAFGVVRQLFERRLAGAEANERASLVVGPAAAAGHMFLGESVEVSAADKSFAVLHGLYWLAANLSAARPLLLTVDDAHWADEPSVRWLTYLARRLEGLTVVLLVAFRPFDPALANASLLALRAEAPMILHPTLLSQESVSALVRATIGGRSSDALCEAVWTASGGNPLYLAELLRAIELNDRHLAGFDPAELLAGGLEGIGRRVIARVRRLDPSALRLAQALAVLGDGCELRHAAATAGLEIIDATRLAASLVRLDVLADDDPPKFIHPVVRDALEASLVSDGRDAAHRSAARALYADRAPAGQIAAHLVGLRPSGDDWVLARLNEAAQQAIESGAPKAAADLLNRALAEPPPAAQRICLLRRTARAEVSAATSLRSARTSRDRAGGRRSLRSAVPLGRRGGRHRTGAGGTRRGR
jgi:class 3 adenylate cyclase